MGLISHRKKRLIPGYLAIKSRVPVILLFLLFFCSRVFPAVPAVLQGTIFNGASGLPVVGAKVVVNGVSAWSTSGGVYTLAGISPGTFTVHCNKAGYDNYTSLPVVFQPGTAFTLNIQLWENLNPPVNVSVLIDTVAQQVPVSWDLPSGNYELLYDDGIQDNFTVWSQPENMNAQRFTPAGFPVKLKGGSLNVGSPANYPPGSNPLIPFQVKVFDAAGPGGAPGNLIAGPLTVSPPALGWIEFAFPSPVMILSGPFYIAMAQGGSAPHACGVAIDETTPQFRSYSRFVTGGGPWYPAGGNFMIRALCEGAGGPMLVTDELMMAAEYKVYRLRQGEEQNPSGWTMIGNTVSSSFTDTNWQQLPCGPYRWGIKAGYAGNRWSPASFSNILGKCWTAPVSIHLTLSCDAADPVESRIRMVNQAFPDTVYSATPDTAGNLFFPAVWKGTYKLIAYRFGYDTLFQSVPVTAPLNLNLTLLQVKSPPANLEVNDSTLLARWNVPDFAQQVFSETWSSGTFIANEWTTEGGTNWSVVTGFGNPAPSAIFNALPAQQNYSQSLVSRSISGHHSTLLKLNYDIFLETVSTTTVNMMAVEIWDGIGWTILKEYPTNAGNISWTTGDMDISAYTDLTFKIRFRASGVNSQDITRWNIDNVRVVASEPAQEQAKCILGYYFYLDNAICGYTTKNAFPIPGSLVQYGQTYNACVRALYGSGYSDSVCTSFTSGFLYPVLNIQGYSVENVAFIQWEKPSAPTDSSFVTPPGLIGYTVLRDDSVIAIIEDADSLSFYDNGLEPGYYEYGVTARYDLAFYGFPGQTGESLPAGPLHITISWGRQLPFFESWNSGSFTYNEWRFSPSQGNWTLNSNEGVPAPAADFRWQPPAVNYDYSLESPSFNGLPFNCASIWLDFDIKLNDRNYSGTEKMIVEVYYNNAWHQKAEISNVGSIPWTNYHIDISPAGGKGFRVRFRATGQNSSEILNWYLDNISIYPQCFPPENLTGFAAGNTVTLTWSPPACYGGNLLNEGFEGSLFPPAQWTVSPTNPSATWIQTDGSGVPGVHTGNHAAGINWDYNHQDEWLIAENVYVNGDLTFWSYAYQGSLHQDHYYVKVSPDNGNTWNIHLDMSSLPPYPGTTGINAWITPYTVDLTVYDGETVDIAWHAVDGDGNGLWYPWAIDDCSIGGNDLPRQITGYDIFRKGFPFPGFVRVNQTIVTDTTWTEQELQPGQYQYFIQALYEECSNISNSDTIFLDIITGDRELKIEGFTVFPNPATGFVTISGSSEIREMKLFESSGRLAGFWAPEKNFLITLDIKMFSSGVYLLWIRQDYLVRTVKLCIIN